MATNVTINVSEAPGQGNSSDSIDYLQKELRRLRDLVGHDIGPFPSAGVDGFLSHFVIAVQFLGGDRAGQIFPFTLEPAVQTVARSQPFIYRGPAAQHEVEIPIPASAKLRNTIRESDFVARPPGFFESGKEHIWLQILNLDAQGETTFGPIRIILGETLRRDYPDIFLPSLGLAQSLGETGFPARFFFNPVAVFETPAGNFRTRAKKAVVASRVVEIPPIGSVSISHACELDSVEDLRAVKKGTLDERNLKPAAMLVALAHPIDCVLHLPGEQAFSSVQARIK